jgi:CubicO group peptidase (beta-lactamase class C family)
MERRAFLQAGLVFPAALRAATRFDGALGGAEPFEEIAAILEEVRLSLRIPGAALGILKGGALRMRGFGVTHIEDPREITPDTLFQTASLTKTMTATALLSLVDQGRLALDVPLREILPRFRVQDEEAAATVTLRHLLTHAVGWEPRYQVEEGDGALGRWIETTGDLEQLFPPGEIWSYNNPAWGVAGHLLERVTGQDVRDALRTLVFDPLELDRASARISEIVTWPLAVGHRPTPTGAPAVVRPFSMGSSIPAGGVNMSLRSLMRYAAFHLGEAGQDAGILRPETRRSMQEPHLEKAPTGEAMGLGFHLRTLAGIRTVAHGGTAGAGHRAHLQLVPERRLAFAILTNHTEGWRLLQQVERAILERYEALTLTPNQPICGYRGHTETLDHVTALAFQPDATDYVGRYRAGRAAPIEVRAAPGGEGLWVGEARSPVQFYGPDLAFSLEERINHEFLREGDEVRWIRIGGQVARRVSPA